MVNGGAMADTAALAAGVAGPRGTKAEFINQRMSVSNVERPSPVAPARVGFRCQLGPGGAVNAGRRSALVGVLVAAGCGRLRIGEERVELVLLRRRLGPCGGLHLDLRSGPSVPFLEERVVGLSALGERLAGERLEGGPALTLLARGEVRRGAGAGRDQLADDDVFLEPDQVILGAVDRRLREHPGRLLEGRRGQEAGGVERGLRDAEEDR